MTEGEGDERKSEIQKIKYLENEKNFLDKVKSIFYNYLSVIICWIKEKYRAQVLSCLRILLNIIVTKSRSRTPANIEDESLCDNTFIYSFEP